MMRDPFNGDGPRCPVDSLSMHPDDLFVRFCQAFRGDDSHEYEQEVRQMMKDISIIRAANPDAGVWDLMELYFGEEKLDELTKVLSSPGT